jgi:hypothetical protein
MNGGTSDVSWVVASKLNKKPSSFSLALTFFLHLPWVLAHGVTHGGSILFQLFCVFCS